MFELSIRTPYEDIFKGEVESLSFAAEDGEMQIFENHASVTASVSFTHIILDLSGKEDTYLGRNGIFLFDNENNTATLLLGYCAKQSEVSVQTAKEYVEFLTKKIEQGEDLSEFQLVYLNNEKIALEQQIEEV